MIREKRNELIEKTYIMFDSHGSRRSIPTLQVHIYIHRYMIKHSITTDEEEKNNSS